MTVPTYAALDPRADDPDVTRIPLAPRRPLEGARVVVVKSMPPGSGVGATARSIIDGLKAAQPTVDCSTYQRQAVVVDSAEERVEVAAQADAVVYIAGPGATMVAVGMQFCTGLEQVGIPCVLVAFDALAAMIEPSRHAVGAAVRTVTIPAPPQSEQVAHHSAAEVLQALTEPLVTKECSTGVRRPQPRPDVAATGTLEEINAHFTAEHLADGLPVLPPTRAAVDRVLTGTSRDPDDIVCPALMPLGRAVTVEQVAINAAMVGLRPQLLPYLLAAVSIMGDKNFESMTRSVNSFAFPLEVGGADVAQLGLNGASNALGPGNPDNTALARSLGLVVRNGGGAVPGLTASPVQGNPVTWSMAFTENPASPWGVPEPETTADGGWISVYTGAFSHAGSLYYEDLDGMARHIAQVEMPAQGVVVMLSLKRARHYAEQGMSRQDVEDYLHHHATMRLGDFRDSGFFPAMKSMMSTPGPMQNALWPQHYLTDPADSIVPAVPRQNLLVRVLGGDESSVAQIWWMRRHRTVPVAAWC